MQSMEEFMTLGIMQPYFFPYLGYWQLINAVDEYVIYDDVTYMKGSWINRNNFLINGEKKLYTILLKNAGSFRLINEISILDDFVKFKKMLQTNYAKAPFFKETFQWLEQSLTFDKENLAAFLGGTISALCGYLNIRTKLIYSSEIKKNNELKGKDKVLDICRILNADIYINAIGGRELYDADDFAERGVELRFLNAGLTPYKQLKNEFVPGLSIIDVLMFNSPERIREMLDEYTLE
jgi:hypothetical protein